MKRALLFLVVLLTACAPSPTTSLADPPPVVSVSSSPAAEPWLEDVYACGAEISAVIRLSVSQSAADLRLRLGEPETLDAPAFQIGMEDLLVVTHPQSALGELTADEARRLFAEGGENVEVWVYASSADIQEIFTREVMQGTQITSRARLALHPEQMLESLKNDNRAVGILPRRWLREPLRTIFSLSDAPVLALTAAEPQGAARELIACLQK
ncbi:MAG: hypothetical protein N2117_06410 [Anaerolineales bacterium]|nr:hypothetical protein [Anaerolineales bacterium]